MVQVCRATNELRQDVGESIDAFLRMRASGFVFVTWGALGQGITQPSGSSESGLLENSCRMELPNNQVLHGRPAQLAMELSLLVQVCAEVQD